MDRLERVGAGLTWWAPGLQLTFNGAIDVKADYVLLDELEFGPGHGDASNDPIATNSYVRKLAAQQSLLKLIEPAGGEESTTTQPEFSWNLVGRTDYRSILYISTFPQGKGLFPSDTPADMYGDIVGKDFNDGRILKIEVNAVPDANGNITFELPESVRLTAGQRYYWGVEAIANGRTYRQSSSFTVAPVTTQADHFAGVTLVTHGFQLAYDSNAAGNAGNAATQLSEMLEVAQAIAKASKGLVFVMNATTGEWMPWARYDDVNFNDVDGMTPADAIGKSLVLVSNWGLESGIADSGLRGSGGGQHLRRPGRSQ